MTLRRKTDMLERKEKGKRRREKYAELANGPMIGPLGYVPGKRLRYPPGRIIPLAGELSPTPQL